MKHFKILQKQIIRCGKITLASIRIASKTTGEVFEATGCAKCSPEDTQIAQVGENLAVRRALNKAGNKAYKATLKLAEVHRLEAEKYADLALEEGCEISREMDKLDKESKEFEAFFNDLPIE